MTVCPEHLPILPSPKPTRLGPRPLGLHLLTSFYGVASAFAAVPSVKAGLFPWAPATMNRAEDLSGKLQDIDDQDFVLGVWAEATTRLESFVKGVLLYQNHPYFRDLAEPGMWWQRGTTRVLDYRPPDCRPDAVPVLVIPSLINRAYVLDLHEERSLMRDLAARGMAPFLVDWGAPGRLEREFGMDEYIADRLVPILSALAEKFSRPVAMIGYCMGGLLALAGASLARDLVSSLIFLATPWDFHTSKNHVLLWLRAMRPLLEQWIHGADGLPVDLLQTLFAGLDPFAVERKFRSFSLLDPSSQAAKAFVVLEDWVNDGVPLTRKLSHEVLFDWYDRNLPGQGEWQVCGQPVRPQDLTIPSLFLVPERDKIVPPASALALAVNSPMGEVQKVSSGHVGMVVGRAAKPQVYESLAQWLGRHSSL